jgi:tetratricopeptide (TPR) repeat protein
MKTLRHALWIPALAITLTAQEIAAPPSPEKTELAAKVEPMEFVLAMDLYQARKYAEAREKFTAIKESFKSRATAPDNPSTLAGFYEMECFRKLGDLDALAAASRAFVKTPLTRKHQLRQLDLYPLWLLVRDKDWPRLEAAAQNLTAGRLPGDQRAQVAYCHALALDALGRTGEAIAAYQTAITADAGGSEEITRQAVLRILQIHRSDADVQAAMKNPPGDENPAARRHLAEAAALAALFELSLGGDTPLPAEFRVFLTFKDAH